MSVSLSETTVLGEIITQIWSSITQIFDNVEHSKSQKRDKLMWNALLVDVVVLCLQLTALCKHFTYQADGYDSKTNNSL